MNIKMSDQTKLKINEIFCSIQGESSFVGFPTVFIRLTGCNLRCTYCDTKYSYFEGELLPIDEILRITQSYKTKHVCITGGEPLLQNSVHILMSQLCDLGYIVSLETSGSKSCKEVDPRVHVILDVKTPDSGAKDSFCFDNLNYVNQNYEFKFVICSENDFFWSESFLKNHLQNSIVQIFYSPSYGQISPRWLAENILSQKSIARLQLQLHKFIWDPEKRGV